MDPETTDDELARSIARRGESPSLRKRAEEAFRTLYDRHARRLLAFLAGRVEQSALDDVHQEVWHKAWQAIPAGYKGGNLRAWLHQIARNVVIDQLRKRKGEPLVEEANLVDPATRAAEVRLVEQERWDALSRCIDQLSQAAPDLADLVRARGAGESYDSFCNRTGMPADKAYRAFHQAKAQLQGCVERATQ